MAKTEDRRSRKHGPKDPSRAVPPRISTAEGLKVAAEAILTLAVRMQGLSEDLAIVRDVLGIPTETSTSKPSAPPATPHLGVPTGTTAEDAIAVDDDDFIASGAPTEPLSRDTAGGRERLDGMEVDVAAKSNKGKLCDF